MDDDSRMTRSSRVRRCVGGSPGQSRRVSFLLYPECQTEIESVTNKTCPTNIQLAIEWGGRYIKPIGWWRIAAQYNTFYRLSRRSYCPRLPLPRAQAAL